MSNCYNSGKIIGNASNLYIAGIIGFFKNRETTIIDNVFNTADIEIKENSIDIDIGGIGAESYGRVVQINNAYNIGNVNINTKSPNIQRIGGVLAINLSNSIILDDCYYLKGTYSVGVGEGASTGVTELDDISKFPNVLEVVNEEGAFKEDIKNINNGYQILEWQ